MSEFKFLIKLLRMEELPKPIKEIVMDRMEEIDGSPTASPQPAPVKTYQPTQPAYQQAASTLALMAKHGDLPPEAIPEPPPAPEPVAVIAHNPATAAAMQSRQQAIAAALSGKIDRVSGRPKKW